MELQKAIELDNEGEGIDKTSIDAGGPAVGKTFHAPNTDITDKQEDDGFVPPKNPDEEVH